jgi:hypothetical protein
MYLGEMAESGKSQNLKALTKSFNIRNESYHFLVVAPTGSATSLLSGSTYHSLFGVNDYKEKSITNLA